MLMKVWEVFERSEKETIGLLFKQTIKAHTLTITLDLAIRGVEKKKRTLCSCRPNETLPSVLIRSKNK